MTTPLIKGFANESKLGPKAASSRDEGLGFPASGVVTSAVESVISAATEIDRDPKKYNKLVYSK